MEGAVDDVEIYEFPERSDYIRQGDIFINIPLIDISLSQIIEVNQQQPPSVRQWAEIVGHDDKSEVTALVSLKPVLGIVISQDCDASNAPDLTLCEIRPFKQVHTKVAQMGENPAKWAKAITTHMRENQKWYYLPINSRIGFNEKMAVDFYTTLRLKRSELEEIRHLRIGRLNAEARAHFRERIAEFYRRYPYDEWYCLNKAEFQAYNQEKGNSIEPYPYQK